jgi:hypothetical protein
MFQFPLSFLQMKKAHGSQCFIVTLFYSLSLVPNGKGRMAGFNATGFIFRCEEEREAEVLELENE